MQQFSKANKYSEFGNKNYTLMEEENEETDAYSEDQDQIEDDMPASNFVNASRTQNQWKFHNNSLSKRGMLEDDNGAIEECANEEDILSNSNKENAAAQ